MKGIKKLLALLLGWAVVRARRWWLAVLLTLPPLLPGLLCDVYPSWPAFLTLCACWCAMLLTSLCKWAAPARRGLLTLAVLPCVGTVLVLLSLALPMEGYSRPQWARSAEAALVSFGNQHLSFLADWTGPFSNRATFVGSAETVDLNSAGPLRYTGRTVLNVTSDYTGRVYLRGTSLARYEDNQWLDLEDGAYDEYIQAAARDMLSPGVPLTFYAVVFGLDLISSYGNDDIQQKYIHRQTSGELLFQTVFHLFPDSRIAKGFLYDIIQFGFGTDSMSTRSISNVIVNTHRKWIWLLKYHSDTFSKQIDIHLSVNIFSIQQNLSINPASFYQIIHTI